MLLPKKLFTFLILLTGFMIFFTSCSNGKIEYSNGTPSCLEIRYPVFDSLGIPSEAKVSEFKKRNSDIFDNIDVAILSNTSRRKIISFTIKIEENKNLPTSTSRTKIIKLNPGEQYELGCTKTITYVLDKNEKIVRLDTLAVAAYTYSVVGEVILKDKK